MADNDWRPTLAVDFDGVVNPYSRGWQGGEMYETEVTTGFWQWIERVTAAGFDVVIHSSRFGDPEAVGRVSKWLLERWQNSSFACSPEVFQRLVFQAHKPPAWLTIDDRCVRFDGDWHAPELQPEAMWAFVPWTQRDKS